MFMMFRLEKLFAFGKFLRFLLHNTSDVTRGARSTIPGRGITAGGQKVPSHKHFFSKQCICFQRPQARTWGRQTCFLPHAPSNLVSSLHNARHDCLSSQNGEICLQKYLPISGKLSITKFLKQKFVDFWSGLTIEITFEGRKKDLLFRK